MDPNATLTELLDRARAVMECESETGDGEEMADLYEMSSLVLHLDEWITKGGFLPQRWRRGEGK